MDLKRKISVVLAICITVVLMADSVFARQDKTVFLTRDRYGDKYYVVDYGWCTLKLSSCPKGKHLAVVLAQSANDEPAIDVVGYMYHYTSDGKRYNKVWHRYKAPDWMGGDWHETPQNPKLWQNAGPKSIAGIAYTFAAKKMGLRR